MGTELIDRRIRKTRKQLKDCLISLLKTKRIHLMENIKGAV